MIVETEKLEQNKREEPMSPLAKTAITGLFGGVFWSSLGYLTYIFNFTKIPPNAVLDPWAIGDWKEGTIGQFMAIFILGLFSILVAYGYHITLRRFEKIWVSIIFGLLLWGLVFFILNPIFPSIEPIKELDVNTIITSICLFTLYGTFIGYSISYEFSELKMTNEPSYSKE
jgi:hypothetical protein